jgi:hypothetical protein
MRHQSMIRKSGYRFSEKIMRHQSMIRKSTPSAFDPMGGYLFRKDHAPPKHDPEKWIPVFRKDHAPAKIYNAILMQRKAIPL